MEDLTTVLYENVVKYLIPVFSLLLIPVFIKYIEKERWSLLAKKKNVWKDFIVKNRSIDECLSKYSKIEREGDVSLKLFYLLLILSSIFFFIEIVIVVSLSSFISGKMMRIQDNSLIFYSSSVTFQFIFLILVALFNIVPLWYSEKIRKITNDLRNNISIGKYFELMWYYYVVLMFSLIQILMTVSVLIDIVSQFKIFAFAVLLIPIYAVGYSALNKQTFKRKTKKIINNEFSKRFPILKITTMGADSHIGRLKDVFNHESIILINGGIETIILWDAVASITEVKETDEEQKQLSYFYYTSS